MDDVSGRIQEMMRRFEEQTQKVSELQAAMHGMQGSASSSDRSVTVTVAPSGAVLDLRLAPNAVRKSAADLQQQIMATIREATAGAAEQMNNAVAPVLGDQFEQFQQAFNVQGPTITPPADGGAPVVPETTSDAQRRSTSGSPTAKRTPQVDDDDDDFSDGSFLR